VLAFFVERTWRCGEQRIPKRIVNSGYNKAAIRSARRSVIHQGRIQGGPGSIVDN
jgi:hypothetical protein